jgi:hypothetical protein
MSLALCAILLVNAVQAADKPSTPAKVETASVSKQIDTAVDKLLATEKMPASARADDAEFLRRAYLDITGIIPTAEKAAAFLDDKDPAKRAKLIDDLLASPAYGRHMADVWTEMLVPRNSDNRRLQAAPLTDWLEEQFNKNRGWNQIVSDMLTASGKQDENGAVTFYLANPTVDKMTDQTSKLFLGLQLQCAQCHNHPFVKWKQDDYWGLAAFFFKVQPDNVKKAAKGDSSPGVTEANKQGGKNRLPESAKQLPPKYLFADEAKLKASEPYRPALAAWLTSADNPYFARAMVNRMWSQFFGRGFVQPVDDMHNGNTPSHPELLQDLTKDFGESGFDLKQLVRAICNSEAYQRTSKTTEANANDELLFSHQNIKPLTPEELYDSLIQVVGKQNRPVDKGNPNPKKGGPNPLSRAGFVTFFRGDDDNPDMIEYTAGIPQVLRLMNSELLNRGGELLTKASRENDAGKAIELLYLGTVSRRPSADELKKMRDYVADHDKKAAYSDILWALLNSSEFALNR